ncbi:hypothetical protein BELL_0137g00110 [Botrytis elliptica]|uniref:Uncharacterized protein n=1 Tax=Botrytis elliptica TaxID=278938 RepID=A0A4Z1JT18_9HELO|nr:hypothetical protein BELL_0137g00110 [Botrytis elliptica]
MPCDVVLLGVMPGQPRESAGYSTLPRRIVMMSDYAADIEKLKPISNTQIGEEIFEKGKILEISQQQILELMEKSNKSDAKLKGKKKYGMAFQLDEQIEVELVRNVVEVYAVQVFKGDAAYEEFMGAIVDQLLTVQDEDAALRDGKLTSLRVKKRMETITNLQAEQLNTQQESRREIAKARAE